MQRTIALIAGPIIAMALVTCGKDSPTKPAQPTPPPPAPPPVQSQATRIAVSPASAFLTSIGQTVQLNATVFDQRNAQIPGTSVSWSSSMPAVATVTPQGLVTAVTNGMATITARSGNVSAQVTVTVRQSAARIEIKPESVTLMAIGETVQLVATVYDRNDQPVVGALVNWTSDNESVASVSVGGLVTAVTYGMATVTASIFRISAQVTVNVTQTVARIEIEPDSAVLTAVGATVQLAAMVYDQNDQPVSDAVVSWISDNESVATVSATGLVAAVERGTARITAQSGVATASIEVAVDLSDRSRLAALYNSTGGQSWTNNTNWLSDEPLGEWYGVTVNADDRVTELDLRNNNLLGPFVSDIGNLEELVSLQLGHNQLTGGIPPEIGQLSNLEDLVLSSNLLTGGIPSEIGQLTSLKELLLSFNRFSGTIPGELGHLVDLTRLSLSVNVLSGPIPGELGRLLDLESLRLDRNNLSGSIPADLSRLIDLKSLILADNEFTGDLPSHLSLLTNLEELVLDHNRLTGALPAELSRLSSLKRLGLADNRLTGNVPSQFGQLTGLTHLRLFSNEGMVGVLPRSLTALSLEELLLDGTRLCAPRDVAFQSWLEGIAAKTVANCSELEREILAALYSATDGPGWTNNTNWLSEASLSNWYGISTDANGYVTGISLEDNDLRGILPKELASLSNLRNLNLSLNEHLSGAVPPEFTSLALEALSLDETKLCVPSDRKFKTWLDAISVTNVKICEDRGLDVLDALFALFNATDGIHWTDRSNWNSDEPLGDWYGITTNEDGRIVELNLAGNHLTGGIPAELAGLTDLIKIDFSDNEGLAGPLPPTLTELTLGYLWLEGTQLCAPPDTSFQNWLNGIPEYSVMNCTDTRAEWYALAQFYSATDGANWTNSDNWLTEAPLEVWYGVSTGNDGRVTELDLTANGLTGSLPSELAQLSSLQELRLGENALSGGIPPELGQLSNLQELNLQINNISGPLPAELGELSSLKNLYLEANNLSGPLPAELGELSNLQDLFLSTNNLTGPLIAELGQLSNLQRLVVPYNNLTGPLPAELGELSNLRTLIVSNNNLTGPIIVELGQLSNLGVLNVSNNNLTGPIIVELGQLSNLKVLVLSNNDLTGPIIEDLVRLSKLRTLNVSNNDLTGAIPPELGGLTNLDRLDLSFNVLLKGKLPSSLTRLSLESLQLGETSLCAPDSPTFQSWLLGIGERRVALCREPSSAAAYLTQAAQSITHPVPLVAGKAALLRVFIPAPPGMDVSMPSVQASFYQGNQTIHEVEIPQGATSLLSGIEESDLTYSANAEIPGSVVMPGVEMVVEIDPDRNPESATGVARRIPESGRQPLNVRQVPPLNLTLVPFLWVESPHLGLLTDTEGLTEEDDLFWQTRNLLPVAEFDLTVREHVWTSTDPFIGYSYEILMETKAIRVMDGSSNHYMGIIRAGGGQAELPGTSSVSVLDAEIIAHELGHNFSLFHSPCGGAFGPDPNYPYNDGSIGSWGYDFRSGMLVSPTTADLMTYCEPQWISDYGFTKAIVYRESEPRLFAAALPAGGKGLLVWGGANENGELELEPGFVVDAAPVLPEVSGPYVIQGESQDGSTLFIQDFGMAELGDGDGYVFAFVIPVQPEWSERLSRISFSGPGGVVYIDRTSDQSAALLLDQSTGRVRGILRDWLDTSAIEPRGRPALPEPGLEIQVSPGIPGPDSW